MQLLIINGLNAQLLQFATLILHNNLLDLNGTYIKFAISLSIFLKMLQSKIKKQRFFLSK